MIPRPIYYDLWGYPFEWTDPSDGWNDDMRKAQIGITNKIITKSASRENFTELGYMKMKIPSQLYRNILEHRIFILTRKIL